MSSKSPFPGLRRVVTGHNSRGEAIVLRDEVLVSDKPYGVYRIDEVPAHIDQELKGEWVDRVAQPGSLVAENGAVSRVYEMPPGHVVPFHRTHSLDIGVVLKGSVTVELDNGEKTVLNEGDTIVQRGTWHAWKNDSSEWNRILFVLMAAHPIEVNAKILPHTVFE